MILDIAQQSERRGANATSGSTNIQTQSLATQVSGQLGDWLPLGGVTESSARRSSGILSRQYSTQGTDLGVWVRVRVREVGDRAPLSTAR